MGAEFPGLLGNPGLQCELPLSAAYSIGRGKFALGPRAYPDWEQRHAYSLLRVQGGRFYIHGES